MKRKLYNNRKHHPEPNKLLKIDKIPETCSLDKGKDGSKDDSKATRFVVKHFTSSIFDREQRTEKLDLAVYDKSRIKEIDPGLLLLNKRFADSQLSSSLVGYLENGLKIKQMTEIQASCLPLLSKDHDNDIMIQARTGSGKTFAFSLSILNSIINGSIELDKKGVELSRASGILCILLSPTRELTRQLYSVISDLVNNVSNPKFSGRDRIKHWIVPGVLSSGAKKKNEKAMLRRGVQILVSTPGRLLDHLKSTSSFRTNTLRWFILDEADMLLQLGLIETVIEIKNILDKNFSIAGEDPYDGSSQFPKKCKMIMCSATLTNLEGLIHEILHNPILVSPLEKETDALRSDDVTHESSLKYSISCTVKQHFIISPAKQRLVCLVGLLKMVMRSTICKSKSFQDTLGFKCIVFFSNCNSVDHFFNIFTQFTPCEVEHPQSTVFSGKSDTIGTKVFKLHGKLTSKDRGNIFQEFVDHSGNAVLFTTDLSGRGLDVRNVSSVIQYDIPLSVKDYVHRIGRTARMGKHGDAWTFLFESEAGYVDLVRSQIGNDLEITQVKPETLFYNLLSDSEKKKGVSSYAAAADLQISLEKYVNCSDQNLMLAHKALTSFMRAYASHKDHSIFGLRRLHLGHVAKSFALPCTPSELSSVLKREVKGTLKKDKQVNRKPMNYKSISKLIVSSVGEFGDGRT